MEPVSTGSVKVPLSVKQEHERPAEKAMQPPLACVSNPVQAPSRLASNASACSLESAHRPGCVLTGCE